VRCPVLSDRVAPPGVSRPFSDTSREIRITRVVHDPAPSVLGVSHPLDGLLSLDLADSLGPLPLMGFGPQALSSEEAETRRRVFCNPASTVLCSLEL
jgi:hypothetical protein